MPPDSAYRRAPSRFSSEWRPHGVHGTIEAKHATGQTPAAPVALRMRATTNTLDPGARDTAAAHRPARYGKLDANFSGIPKDGHWLANDAAA